MDRPPTSIDVPRDEGQVRVTFTPGLTIDQWAQTFSLKRPMTRAEFEQAAQALAQSWGVQVSFDPSTSR
jgi:hypothetical protein